MKLKLLLYLVLSVLTLSTYAQTYEDEIKTTFAEYFMTLENKQSSSTLDYIYPELFNHFPKTVMLTAMEDMFADTSIIIHMKAGTIEDISKSLEISDITYVLIKYRYFMTMIMNDLDESTISEGGEELNAAELTYYVLKKQFGEKNVIFTPESNTLDIRVNSEMYAIKNPKYKGWKFLEKKDEQKAILEMMVPKKVLKKLK